MKTVELTLKDRMDIAVGWLLNSGIQSKEGGFYAWQNMEDNSLSYLYSEITGYAITTMCFLYSITKDNAYINSAKRAAQWLMRDALSPDGAVLTRKYLKDAVEHYSFESGNIYSFDCAMAAFGMLKLYKITKEEDYLNCASRIIEFLNTKMLAVSGLYYPVFDARQSGVYEDPEKWSTQSGSFHSKIALCLCELASIKKDNHYSETAARLIDSSIKNFYKGNRFITSMPAGTSHFHPYCYTLEGMLYYSYKLKDGKYEKIIKDAFNWLTDFQQEDGGFPTQVYSDGRIDIAHRRSDIHAQILRLSYFIRADFDNDKLLDRLLEFQNTAGDFKGSFIYGADQNGERRHSNSWCSMFAFQALSLASGSVSRNQALSYLV